MKQELEKLTFRYVREAYTRCSNCGAHPRLHYVVDFIKWSGDSVIKCGYCQTYIKMWDF